MSVTNPPEDELRKEIEELLTQVVVDIHSKTVRGGLLLPDATIFKATDKILTLYNTYTTNKIIEELEQLLPKLLGGAREYDENDLVSINYKKGYTEARKYLQERIKALNHRKDDEHGDSK